MIELKNVTKRYNDLVVLDNITLSLKSGLIGLCGKSGTGKSTLLNIISLLDEEYEGEVYYNSINLKNIKNKEKFRYQNFSYVFQTPILFNLLTVFDNICFSLSRNYENEKKVKKMLSLVNLKVSLDQIVNTLSGGEKQRLSLARALFNEQPVLICDELTSPLDHSSKEEIMALLKKISKDKLVICVSHEEEILTKYADSIYSIEDKKIKLIKQKQTNKECKIKKINNFLNFKVMFSFVKSNLKAKKIRSMISYLAVSLGLTCLGITFLITSNVSKSIETSLLSSINQNQKIIKLKQEETFKEKYACEESVLLDIKNEFSEIKNIRTYYLSNFENMFLDNYFTLQLDTYSVPFSELSLNSINDYKLLNGEEVVYPKITKPITDEEMILSLREKDLKRICQNLNINNSLSSLTHYLENRPLNFILHVNNPNWSYQDQVYLDVNHFIMGDNLSIYQLNNKWNEYIFEERMFLKTSFDLIGGDNLPWTLKKIYCFETENGLNLINKLYEKYDSLYFEFIDKNKIYVTKQNSDHLSFSYLNENLKNYFLANNNIYFTYDKLLVSSFANLTFLLKNENEVISLIDELTFSENNINYLTFDGDFVYGGISKLLSENNIFFDIYENIDILYGRKSISYQEIVISNKIAQTLFNKPLEEIINQTIYFLTIKDTFLNKQMYQNYFVYCPLKIVGITNQEDKFFLYGDKMWLSNFYVDNFSYNYESVLPTYCLVNNFNNQLIDDYLILNPNQDIINDLYLLLDYIQKGLIILSSMAIISSILMNIITIYLFILENRKQMGLLLTLGIDKTSIIKLYLLFSFFIGFKALMYSIISLFISSLLIEYQLFKTLKYFSFLSFFKMIFAIGLTSFMLAIIIGLISSFNVIKNNSLKILKEK